MLGASGSGASTLGRALSRRLELRYFDSDDYYHGPSDPPFRNPRSPLERYELILRDLGGEGSWVLGGGVAGWEPQPELRFTLLVLLWAPAELRVKRLRERERERFGARVLSGGDMHRDHEDFIDWARRYDIGGIDGKTRARHEAYLLDQACPVLRLTEVRPPDELVTIVFEQFDARG
ncbi:MAG: adenylate kinase [Myxococcota bacterium]